MTEKTLRIGLAGLNQTPLDWKGNRERIQRVWKRAKDLGVSLLCFPELALSGYGCEDAFLHPDTGRRAVAMAVELARDCGREIVLLGLPFWFEGDLYNGVAVFNKGKIRGVFCKCHLAREGIHYEPRWFRPWPTGKQRFMDIAGDKVPIGTLVYNAAGFTFSLEICEDAWVAPEERPCRLAREAQWIFNTSASHFSLGKADIRENIVKESSKRFGVGYAYTNLVGCESGRAIYDGEQLIAQNGKIIDRSARLYMTDELLMPHDISYRPNPTGGDVTLDLAEDASEDLPPIQINIHRKLAEPDQEFAKAASLALFDYMRKSRSRGFTLSLSGGVDSASVAVLVFMMAQRIFSEMTLSQRREKLAYFPELDLESDPKRLTAQLLTTVYQSTRNSGEVTRNAAEQVAKAIGANHLNWDVDHLVEGYKGTIGSALGRTLNWKDDDIALQNIQARTRGPGVWMLANLNRSLLLATSNRSEVAVGYATMDGDTCGGLAPIAGIEKSFLRRWLMVVEQEGLRDLPAIPQLGFVNRQKPTAELRPPGSDQTDESDLMPYECLDAIEDELLGSRHTPLEIFETLSLQYRGKYSRRDLHRWVGRFCRLFSQNQWKRERFAPAFHLDDRKPGSQDLGPIPHIVPAASRRSWKS